MENPYATPRTDPEAPVPAESFLATLPRFSTWYVVGLAIITLGFYLLFLAYRRTRQLNALLPPESTIGMGFMLTTLGLVVLSLPLAVLVELNPHSQELVLLDALANIAGGILTLVWAFRFRERLRQHVNTHGVSTRIGPILTFFLQFIYLQYKINQLKDSAPAAPLKA